MDGSLFAAIVFGRSGRAGVDRRAAFSLVDMDQGGFFISPGSGGANRGRSLDFFEEFESHMPVSLAPRGDVHDVSSGTLNATVGRVGGEPASNRSTMIMWPRQQ